MLRRGARRLHVRRGRTHRGRRQRLHRRGAGRSCSGRNRGSAVRRPAVRWSAMKIGGAGVSGRRGLTYATCSSVAVVTWDRRQLGSARARAHDDPATPSIAPESVSTTTLRAAMSTRDPNRCAHLAPRRCLQRVEDTVGGDHSRARAREQGRAVAGEHRKPLLHFGGGQELDGCPAGGQCIEERPAAATERQLAGRMQDVHAGLTFEVMPRRPRACIAMRTYSSSSYPSRKIRDGPCEPPHTWPTDAASSTTTSRRSRNAHAVARPSSPPPTTTTSARSIYTGRVADGFDVVAVGIAHESAEIVRVILGPHTTVRAGLPAREHGRIEEGDDRVAIGCRTRCEPRRASPPVVAGPIQKYGRCSLP